MASRRTVLTAFALVAIGLSVWVALKGLQVRNPDPPAACSSCDARHQKISRNRATPAPEVAP